MRRKKTIYDGDAVYDADSPYLVDDPRDAALADSQFTVIDNVLIHYVHHSRSPDVPTVVFVHGFSGESRKRGKRETR
jgi:pimeloyl-ACP methyl ester carboxylesterase